VSIVYGKGVGLRKSQQDEVKVVKTKEKILAVLSDGMGGHDCGERASEIVVETFTRRFFSMDGMDPEAFFKTSFLLAQAEMMGTGKAMGATVASVLIEKQKNGLFATHVFWLGDSRVYLLTKTPKNNETIPGAIALSKRRLWLLTEDDSEVWQEVINGEIPLDKISRAEGRNVLKAGVFSGYLLAPVERKIKTFTLQEGDKLFLCSDGVWECLSTHEELGKLLSEADLKRAEEKIIGFVEKSIKEKSCSGDNYSFVLIELNEELFSA